MLRKYSGPLIIIATTLLISVSASVYFWKRATTKNKIVSELTEYIGHPLPQMALVELRSGDDYFNRAKGGKALIVFAITGCAACQEELQVIAETAAEIKSGIKIYIVMFEDQTVVEKYVQTNHIKFSILLDKHGKVINDLRLRSFPANFRLEDGIVKEAWLGMPRESVEFLKRINL